MRCLALLALIALAGCSKVGPREPDRDRRTFDLPESMPVPARMDSSDAPAIAVSAAPGVAFNYRYAFRLPNARISAVQEAHAQMCEKLGIDRCRITGMRYRLVDEDDVSAMLAFKLEPAIARDFGKRAEAGVKEAQGMLVDSEISGVDMGERIAAADRNRTALREELAKIDTQLAQPGLSAPERTRLEQQAQDLRRQLRAADDDKDDARSSLATTPMVFNYGSGGMIPGFDGTSPLRDAFATGWRSFVTMVSFVVIAIGVLVPWALLGAIAYLVWRKWRPRSGEAVTN